MKAFVVFDSRYGNTEKIAVALGRGLGEAGLEVRVARETDVSPESLKGYDLLCVSGPTEWHSASKSTKEFLRGLEDVDLTGTHAFAFDTKLAGVPLSGSAAGVIEKRLKKQGCKTILGRESALVSRKKGGTNPTLNEGEEERFEKIGVTIGGLLIATDKSSGR